MEGVDELAGNLGTRMLNTCKDRKEAELHIRILENRIKHLEDNELKAKKALESIERKATFHESLQERYAQDSKLKETWRQEQSKQTHELYQKVQLDKRKQDRLLRRAKRTNLALKRSQGNEVKLQTKIHEDVIKQMRNEDLRNLNKHKESIQFSVLKAINDRRSYQEEHRAQLKRNYIDRIQNDFMTKKEYLDRMQELAKVEVELTEKLNQTLEIEKETKSKLQSAIRRSREIVTSLT